MSAEQTHGAKDERCAFHRLAIDLWHLAGELAFCAGLLLLLFLVGRALFLGIGGSNAEQCFTTCPLDRLGREYTAGGLPCLVQHCPDHDRTFLEPVPVEVWLELRSQGVPELRTRWGMIR